MMAVVLVNPDNTVNFIGEELFPWLNLDNVQIEQFPDCSVEDIMNNIPPLHCVWDSETRTVKDERKYPELVKPVNKFFESKDEEALEFARAIRNERNARLRYSDSRISAFDNPNLDVEAWKMYRQKLRDIPQDGNFPYNVKWPKMPDSDD